VIFKIPQNCILNISHALSSPLSKEILDALSKLDDESAFNEIMTAELLLWVYMSEQGQSTVQYFSPYLGTLSKEAPNPHYWQASLLQGLEGTNLEILNGSQQILEEQSSLLLSLIPHMSYASKEQLERIFSYKSLSWARGHYLSRGWDNIFELDFGGDDIVDVNELSAMVPILDICNHKPGEDWITLKAEDAMLLVVTSCDLNVGDEIFGNYGDKSNEILLYAYGFSIQNNPFDSVALKLGTVGHGSNADALPYYINKGEGLEGIPEVSLQTLFRCHVSIISHTGAMEGDSW
jgi:hypothetical protein